jgi:hypothetical protein
MVEVVGLYASGSQVLREFAVFSITQDAHRTQGQWVCGLSSRMAAMREYVPRLTDSFPEARPLADPF